MRRCLFLALFLSLFFSGLTSAQSQYRVTANKLNIREIPSTRGGTLGSLSKGDTIQVLSIQQGWASLLYNSRTGYVSSSYLEELIVLTDTLPPVSDTVSVISQFHDSIVYAPLIKDSDSKKDDLSSRIDELIRKIQFFGQLNLGVSDFVCYDVNPKAGLGFGLSFGGRLDYSLYSFNNVQLGGSEFTLGYHLRGSAALPINYLELRIIPVLARYPVGAYTLIGKVGLNLGYPISNVKTKTKEHDASGDVGLSLGLGVETGQKYGLSLSLERGFCDVTNDGEVELNNIGFFVSFMYFFDK